MARTALAIVLFAMLLVVCIRLVDLKMSPAAEPVGTEAPSQLAHKKVLMVSMSSFSSEFFATFRSEILDRLGGEFYKLAFASRWLSRDLSFQSLMNGSNFNYLASVSLGTPPSKHQLMVDTGSDLTWIQCEPCTDCFNQTGPLFNPATSSTYKVISGDSPACIRSIHKSSCPLIGHRSCCYRTGYVDDSDSQGVLSSDTLGLNGATTVRIPGMIFGCSHKTKGYFDSNSQGILGLGPGPSSLVSQLGTNIGRKFSYCLASYPSRHGLLSFGNKAIVSGGSGGSGVVSTPLVIRDYLYYVTLEEVVIGDGKGRDYHKIAVGTFGSPQGGNVIVDTGTFLTFLDVEIVEEMERMLSAIIKLPPIVKTVRRYSLCYKASESEFLAFPQITFRFAGSAPMRLQLYNTFVAADEGLMCLAILPHSSRSILGSLAQGNFYMGYDLEAKQLYFTLANCNKMAMLAEESWLHKI